MLYSGDATLHEPRVVHHSKSGRLMSALGQKRTSRHVRFMSALPPKADIAGAIRFVPKADIRAAVGYN